MYWVKAVEETLKHGSNELTTLVVFATNSAWVMWKPKLDELSCMWHKGLWLILVNSLKLGAVSMHMSALNSKFLLFTLMVHGPIKSIVTSS
jgi:hypothetical protein